MGHRPPIAEGIGGAGEEAGEAVEMTKERRDELRRFADQWEEAVLACGLAPDMNPAELRALLDSDERLEAVEMSNRTLPNHWRMGNFANATVIEREDGAVAVFRDQSFVWEGFGPDRNPLTLDADPLVVLNEVDRTSPPLSEWPHRWAHHTELPVLSCRICGRVMQPEFIDEKCRGFKPKGHNRIKTVANAENEQPSEGC